MQPGAARRPQRTPHHPPHPQGRSPKPACPGAPLLKSLPGPSPSAQAGSASASVGVPHFGGPRALGTSVWGPCGAGTAPPLPQAPCLPGPRLAPGAARLVPEPAPAPGGARPGAPGPVSGVTAGLREWCLPTLQRTGQPDRPEHRRQVQQDPAAPGHTPVDKAPRPWLPPRAAPQHVIAPQTTAASQDPPPPPNLFRGFPWAAAPPAGSPHSCAFGGAEATAPPRHPAERSGLGALTRERREREGEGLDQGQSQRQRRTPGCHPTYRRSVSPPSRHRRCCPPRPPPQPGRSDPRRGWDARPWGPGRSGARAAGGTPGRNAARAEADSAPGGQEKPVSGEGRGDAGTTGQPRPDRRHLEPNDVATPPRPRPDPRQPPLTRRRCWCRRRRPRTRCCGGRRARHPAAPPARPCPRAPGTPAAAPRRPCARPSAWRLGPEPLLPAP